MSDEIRIPDIEVIIGASANDVAVFAFYRRNEIHDGYEVVSAIDGTSSRAALRTILQDCITALSEQNWKSVDELRALSGEEVSDPPF